MTDSQTKHTADTSTKREKGVIDLGTIVQTMWKKRKNFFIAWPIVFVLSALWILPQPRYYTSTVSLAPEMSGEDAAGGLASIASNFGINLGGGGVDAIYPELYPELLASNTFIAELLHIQVTTADDSIHTDYLTYMTKHQKKNWLTEPFKKMKSALFTKASDKAVRPAGEPIDPFRLTKKETDLFAEIKDNVKADVDKKTNVITLSVTDQDALVSAILTDSVREHLQNFIINYRTQKARIDMEHYQHLMDSAKHEYDTAVEKYSIYCDTHQDAVLQVVASERDKLEGDMQMKLNTLTAASQQYQLMKAKLQERTPVFTVLRANTVPTKPAGPKRMIFVLAMLVLSSFVMGAYFMRDWILKK